MNVLQHRAPSPSPHTCIGIDVAVLRMLHLIVAVRLKGLLAKERVALLLHIEVDDARHLFLPNFEPVDGHVVLSKQRSQHTFKERARERERERERECVCVSEKGRDQLTAAQRAQPPEIMLSNFAHTHAHAHT